MSPLSHADRVDRFVSFCAGVAAITAVAVSLYQTSLAREQLRASAWPYLAQGTSYSGTGPFRLLVSNDGIGPAKVRSFHVFVDAKPIRKWNDVVRALTGEGEPALVYSSMRRGAVLPAGTSRTLLSLPLGPRALAFAIAAQTRLHTVVCYCSVYDECWHSDSESDDPTPVRACTDDATTEFLQ